MNQVIHNTKRLPFNLKVLVVDDDYTVREVSTKLMQRFGFDAICVEGGKQAVDLCETRRFDVIFMDLNMPEMDGFEATKAIRKLEGGARDAYIVALSGTVFDKQKVTQCIESGMNDCFVKPLKEATLYQRMELWERLSNAGKLK